MAVPFSAEGVVPGRVPVRDSEWSADPLRRRDKLGRLLLESLEYSDHPQNRGETHRHIK
jgi:hypothetical protein